MATALSILCELNIQMLRKSVRSCEPIQCYSTVLEYQKEKSWWKQDKGYIYFSLIYREEIHCQGPCVCLQTPVSFCSMGKGG